MALQPLDEFEVLRIECFPPSNERKSEQTNSLQTYHIRVQSIDGIRQASDLDGCHLQAILFDQKYRKFVGSCWVGKSIQLNKNKKNSFNQNFYFYTSIPGNELLLVIELIIWSKIRNCYKTFGWTCLPLLETEGVKPHMENARDYKVALMHGTPLALLILKEGTKGINSAQHAMGAEILLSLAPYPILLQLVHLVPENVLLDPTDIIPGLISESADNLTSTDCTYKLRLQKCVTFILERLHIKVQPSLESAETYILEKIREGHRAAGSPHESNLKAKIVQRRLQVAVHNGYRFIHEPDFYHLHVEQVVSPSDGKSHRRSSSMGSINFTREDGLTLRCDVKLSNVPDDPDIAIVFLVEYIISLPSSQADQPLIPLSVSKSPTSNIPLAWGFVKVSNLRANSSQIVVLTCNPTHSPHQILFLRTSYDFEMQFTGFSLSKQSKNSAASVLSVEDHRSVASASSKTQQSAETSYLYSPATNNSAAKHKSVGDIPMTVHQSEVGCPRRGNSNTEVKEKENNMALQEVALVPSSLALVPPLLHSFPIESGVSFKEFTKLYWDKLQPILDHHGKSATIIDGSIPYNIDKQLEFRYPPQQNECMIHFLAISGLEDCSEALGELFFTFQFYRFLPVRTESLFLKLLSQNEDNLFPKSSLVYVLQKSRDGLKIPGFQVTYNVDPSELGSGEYKPFLQYLIKQSVHIDLWNGESLLYFGTVTLPLKYFCRQGKEAVSVFLELDIINCEFSDESLCQTALPAKVIKGKLHLRLATVRHPLPTKALEKLEDKENSESIIIGPKKDTSTSDLTSSVISKAKPIVETDRELSKLLASRCVLNNPQVSQESQFSEERRRKLARMEAVRNLENENKTSFDANEGMHHFFKERQRDLLSIESYIHKNKSEMIQSLLHTSITSEKVIYPVIGNKTFFEFVIENPYQVAKKVEISWKCSQLCMVTDFKLWQYLRNMHNISQKIESLAFGNSDSEVPSVLIQAREQVHVPFTYHCLAAHSSQSDMFKTSSGHHFTSAMLSSAPVSSNLAPSTVKVRFMTEDQTLLGVLILKIQPLPPSFSHVFKFLSMEHSMFKKCIRINPEGSSNHKISVKCTDQEVACSVQEPQDWEEDVNIHIKAPTRSAGKCREFYLFIYRDMHQVIAFQTWFISICPLQRIDLSCIAGQLMRSSLLIRGTHATNLVRCFPSSHELHLHPSEPFVLSPFAVQELSMNIRTLLPGTKYFQITMVNQALEQALQSWLLVLASQKPSVSKAFQVHLSVGKEATKRITYKNPYNQSRSFALHSSHPHLLRLREHQFSIPAGKSYYIGLYFPPQEFVFTETLFLYLNDMGDKNEETYCIKVICQ